MSTRFAITCHRSLSIPSAARSEDENEAQNAASNRACALFPKSWRSAPACKSRPAHHREIQTGLAPCEVHRPVPPSIHVHRWSPAASSPPDRQAGQERRSSRPCTLLAVDRDTLHLLLRPGRLRQGHGQHAALERGINIVRLDIVDRDAPLESAIVALAEEPILVLRLGPFLAFDDEDAVREFDADIFLLKAGQFRRDLDLLVGLADLDVRPPERAIEQAVGAERRHVETAEDVIEYAVHFTVQRQQRICIPRRCTATSRLRFHGMRSLIVMVISPFWLNLAKGTHRRGWAAHGKPKVDRSDCGRAAPIRPPGCARFAGGRCQRRRRSQSGAASWPPATYASARSAGARFPTMRL